MVLFGALPVSGAGGKNVRLKEVNRLMHFSLEKSYNKIETFE